MITVLSIVLFVLVVATAIWGVVTAAFEFAADINHKIARVRP